MNIVFYKGISQLEFLLGDPRQKQAEFERDEALKRQEKERQDKALKDKNKFEKDQEMKKMKEISIDAIKKAEGFRGAVNTIAFCFFAVMHVSLA